MTKDKYFLSWKWVDEQLNEIGDRLEGVEVEFVSGIPRGGLIPAVMMSHAFGFKYISYSSAKLLPSDLRKKTLVIDDIADTGHTLNQVIKLLKSRKPKSLEVCCLLNKFSRRETDIDSRWVGFNIPDEFVVGYGIDYAQDNRHLPFIGKVVQK